VAEFPTVISPGEWISVFRSVMRWPCEERALVLKAMQIEHHVTEQPDGCHVLVPAALVPLAMEQLRLYAHENPRRHIEPWPDIAAARGMAGAAGFVIALLVAYLIQAGYRWGIDWTETGQLIAGRVTAGEWWRTITALTLHGDVAHVVGNMLFGAFFTYLCGQYLGSGVALLAIVWSAAAGNLLNALVQSGAHRSIGASTAVFAALGLVAAFVWGLSRRYALGWARRSSPVVGAVALLAYTGTGDQQTDIVAHLAGFLAGAVAGLLLLRLKRGQTAGALAQGLTGLLAGGTVIAAWVVAMTGD